MVTERCSRQRTAQQIAQRAFGASRAHHRASLIRIEVRKMKFTSLFLTMCGFALGPATQFGQPDAGWTSRFFIAGGFLSHWQVWVAFAISGEVCAYSLRRGAEARVRVAS